MKAMINSLDRLLGAVIDGFGMLSGFIVAFMAAAISAEVIIREFGGPAFGWTLELCEYGLLVVAFLGAPWVLRQGDHIRVDILLRSVSPRTRNRMFIAANSVAALTSIILAYFAVLAAYEAYSRGALIFKNIVLQQWIILSILPIGVALLGLEFALRAGRRLAGGEVPQEDVTGVAL